VPTATMRRANRAGLNQKRTKGLRKVTCGDRPSSRAKTTPRPPLREVAARGQD
jgi:hypothetical protein